MKLYKADNSVVVESNQEFFLLAKRNFTEFINRDNLYDYIVTELSKATSISSRWLESQTPECPMDTQEIWAAGVTYLRSRDARMEESKEAGGGDFYDKVYAAERPELFFKATCNRTVANEGTVRIRRDSIWNVPEPELTLFANANGNIVGYTIGNDMSSRSIEGENPLYLPQAKVYDGCASLGPCLYVPAKPIEENTAISMTIKRNHEEVFYGSILVSRMKRKHAELVRYLFSESTFPSGVFLMTGTGVVPPNDFTLASGDQIIISIDNIGVLKNFVA